MKIFISNHSITGIGVRIPFCSVCQGKLISIMDGEGEERENYCPRCKKLYSREELAKLRG